MRLARCALALLLLGGHAAAAEDVPEAAEPASAFEEALAAPEPGLRPGDDETPAFFGDLFGGVGLKPVRLPGGGTRFAFAPVNRRAGAVKIADNESPRPADRAYYSYARFSRVNFSSNADLAPLDLQRHVIGFEKTLLSGWGSLGLRVPIVVADGPPELATRQLADVTLVTKVALWDDRARGNLVSAGLAVTVPTGRDEVFTSPGSGNRYTLSDTILQPFAGYIYTISPRLFAHGFTALAVPTDSRDAALLFNDLGLGWRLWRDDDTLLRGVIPTWELHVSTPLNRRGKGATPVAFSDVVNMNWGLHVLLRRSTLGGAVGVPLTGPRPYSVEAAARYTWRF